MPFDVVAWPVFHGEVVKLEALSKEQRGTAIIALGNKVGEAIGTVILLTALPHAKPTAPLLLKMKTLSPVKTIDGVKIWPKATANVAPGVSVNVWIGVNAGLHGQTELFVRSIKVLGATPTPSHGPSMPASETALSQSTACVLPASEFHLVWVLSASSPDEPALTLRAATECGIRQITVSGFALDHAVVFDASGAELEGLASKDVAKRLGKRPLLVCKLHAVRHALAATHLKIFVSGAPIAVPVPAPHERVHIGDLRAGPRALFDALVTVRRVPDPDVAAVAPPSLHASRRQQLEALWPTKTPLVQSSEPEVTLEVGVRPRLDVTALAPPTDGKVATVLLVYSKGGSLLAAPPVTAPEYLDIALAPPKGLDCKEDAGFLVCAFRKPGEEVLTIASIYAFTGPIPVVCSLLLDVIDDLDAKAAPIAATALPPVIEPSVDPLADFLDLDGDDDVVSTDVTVSSNGRGAAHDDSDDGVADWLTTDAVDADAARAATPVPPRKSARAEAVTVAAAGASDASPPASPASPASAKTKKAAANKKPAASKPAPKKKR